MGNVFAKEEYMEPEILDTKKKRTFTICYNVTWSPNCFGISEAKLVKNEIKKIFPSSTIYMKKINTMIIKVELRSYNNKLIWKTMQKNLYGKQMLIINKML